MCYNGGFLKYITHYHLKHCIYGNIRCYVPPHSIAYNGNLRSHSIHPRIHTHVGEVSELHPPHVGRRG